MFVALWAEFCLPREEGSKKLKVYQDGERVRVMLFKNDDFKAKCFILDELPTILIWNPYIT